MRYGLIGIGVRVTDPQASLHTGARYIVRAGKRAWAAITIRLVEVVSNGHAVRYFFDSADRLVAWKDGSRKKRGCPKVWGLDRLRS